MDKSKTGKVVPDKEEEDDEQREEIDEEGEASSSDGVDEAEIWKVNLYIYACPNPSPMILSFGQVMKATLPSADEDADLMDDDEMESDPDDDEQHSSRLGSKEDDETDLAEGSDDEDLISQDGLIEYDGLSVSDEDREDEWAGVGDGDGGKKRKRMEDTDSRRSARKKLKSLPAFASYEDYAAMIEADGEDSGS